MTPNTTQWRSALPVIMLLLCIVVYRALLTAGDIPTSAILSSPYSHENNLSQMVDALRRGLEENEPQDPLQYAVSALQALGTPKLIIVGPPAAGKGTQCELMVKQFGFVHISTGDLLRAEVKEGTKLGKQAADLMSAGKLVPDDLVLELLLKRMDQDDVRRKGWLLDGFPRTPVQLEMMVQRKIIADSVVLLDVPDSVVIERVEGRRTDPETGKVYHLKTRPPPPEIVHRLVQRPDDTRDKTLERLRQYHAHSDPLLKKFTCPVHQIKAQGKTPSEIMALLMRPVQTTRWALLARKMELKRNPVL
eukprot:TRINITY_DN37811_c0_g1_i1.p1 TRINITY_DN37811_c0_g1~~TRINITY_DN37811_c0_g1_i1.p1  ORF type:complete len:317 (+),score=118.73 TRINITY_DN37811_c0_g1_i1:37-951(+)